MIRPSETLLSDGLIIDDAHYFTVVRLLSTPPLISPYICVLPVPLPRHIMDKL